MCDTINTYGNTIKYKIGHFNLKVKIKEANVSFSGEISRHIFFNEKYFRYDDVIYPRLEH